MKIIKEGAIEIYELAQSDRLFDHLETLLIAVQGVAVSVEFFTLGHTPSGPGDYINVCARHLPKEIRLPMYGPVQAAMINRRADCVQLSVSDRTPKPEAWREIAGFRRFIDAIFIPFLVSYHEENIDFIRLHYTKDRTKWPSAWQMSWAIRNAASHNGRVFERETQQAVIWKGLSFAPAQDASTPILSLINGGDILMLMFDMELELGVLASL